jgi:glutathione S-transferase
VPAVEFGDGTKVCGSRAILRELERRAPDPPLFPPAESPDRRRVEEAEEWGEQVLQPLTRRVVWRALAAAPGAQGSYLGDTRVVPWTPRPVARAVATPMAAVARRLNGATDPAVRADLAHLPMHLDRADGWIRRGTLGGAQANAGDLQVGASVALLATLEDLAPVLAGRPVLELARRWFPGFPGRTPAGALPAEWLPESARGPVRPAENVPGRPPVGHP